jgi:hypothetical protein
MATTAERLAALETMVAEIHGAVVGNGSKGSTVRERLSSLETQTDWRHRTVYSIVPSLLVAALSHLGIHLPIGGPSA